MHMCNAISESEPEKDIGGLHSIMVGWNALTMNSGKVPDTLLKQPTCVTNNRYSIKHIE